MAELTLLDALASWGVVLDPAEADTPEARRGIGDLNFFWSGATTPLRVSVREQDHRMFRAWLASRPRPLTKEWLDAIDEDSAMTDDDYAFVAYIAKAWGRIRARPLGVPASIELAEGQLGAPTDYGRDPSGRIVAAIWENPKSKEG